jgi:glycosyltransferase involved in cell wall biosynthesis
MNILCVDQYAVMGGGQTCLFDLMPAFQSRNWNVRVALPGSGPFEDRLRDIGINTHRLRSRTYSSMNKPLSEKLAYVTELPRHALQLIRICRTHRITLLYVNGPRYLPAATVAARILGINLIFHCHHRLTQDGAIRLTGRALQWVGAEVIACCRHAAEPLLPYLEQGSFHLLYNGVPQVPTALKTVTTSKRTIGVVGRIAPEKGHLDFVNAVRILAPHYPSYSFAIVGAPLFADGTYLEQVKKASKELPITFTGWKDNPSEIFQDLDLLVVPSTDLDATPRVILEAFSAGVPVVAFAVGGIPEIIKDGWNGFLVERRNPSALAEKIASVLTLDVTALEVVKMRARIAWEQRFSIDIFRQSICAVISDSDGTASTPDLSPRFIQPGVEPISGSSIRTARN